MKVKEIFFEYVTSVTMNTTTIQNYNIGVWKWTHFFSFHPIYWIYTQLNQNKNVFIWPTPSILMYNGIDNRILPDFPLSSSFFTLSLFLPIWDSTEYTVSSSLILIGIRNTLLSVAFVHLVLTNAKYLHHLCFKEKNRTIHRLTSINLM